MGDRSRYFAYGSHLPGRRIWNLAPRHITKQVARLPDHRLIFTRRPNCDGGLASLEPVPGVSVYGVLYEVDGRRWARFDKKWGASYERRLTGVEIEGDLVSCYAYFARDKAAEELPPRSAYMKSICKAARRTKLPRDYIDFLADTKATFQVGNGTRNCTRDNGTLLLAATQDRRKSQGMPLVRLNRDDAKLRGIKRYCAIQLTRPAGAGLGTGNKVADSSRYAIARVQLCKTEVPRGTCQADQSLRNCLGIPGLYCHGERVSVAPVYGRLPSWSLIRPRALVLRLHSLSKHDTEKNYCVLHPELIKALGLAEGEYVRVYAVPGTGKIGSKHAAVRKLRVEATTLRVFAGIGESVEPFPGEKIEYPLSSRIYIDQDGRQVLDLESYSEMTAKNEWLDTPILARPALLRAFLSRMIIYGITVFLGIEAFSFLLEHFFGHLGGWLLAVVSIVAALVATGIVSLLDLRGRLRY